MNHTAFFEPEHRTMAAGFQAAWNLDQARREAASGAASAEGGGRVGSTISVSELGRFSVCLGLQFH